MPNPIVYIAVGSESEEETEPESEEDSGETEEQNSQSEEEEEEGFIPVMESPRVLSEKEDEEGGEGKCCSSAGEVGENSQGNEWNRGDIDGLFCTICMEAWTTAGDHHVWKCTMKDVRKLFASRIVAIDGESQKRIQSLEAKCISLEKKNAVLIKNKAEWRKKEAEWKQREALLEQQLRQFKETTNYLEHLLDVQSRTLGHPPSMGGYQVPSLGQNLGSEFYGNGPFILQKELGVDGARLFDIDASSKIILMARRLQGLSGTHVLTKTGLVAPYMREDIILPFGTKAVRDLHICPLVVAWHFLLPSETNYQFLAQKLTKLPLYMIYRTDIVTFDFQAPAWSCSWDLNSSHQIYAGLQNGSLCVFDMRQTAKPLEFVHGLTSNPIHTIYSTPNSTLPSGVTTVLSASSSGICHWNFGGSEQGRFLVSEAGNQGACISLAYSPSSDDMVASFRPRIDNSNEMASSQPLLTPAHALGQGVQGSHVHLKRVGSNCYQKLAVTCANVNDVRLLRSTVMNIENHGCLFVSGDELTCELVLQELPSFTVVQHLKSPKQPIYDESLERDCRFPDDTGGDRPTSDGVSYQTDDQGLREAFSQYGEVVEARVRKQARDLASSRTPVLRMLSAQYRPWMDSNIRHLRPQSSCYNSFFLGNALHGRQVRVNYAVERLLVTLEATVVMVATIEMSSSGSYGGNVGYGGGNYGGKGNYGGFDQSATTNFDGGNFNYCCAEDGFKEGGEAFDSNEPMNENFRDDDDENRSDFAKRA
ncbi:Transducin/WD40 repeat-like superfamily protein, putative isoform 2 [Hibiscus syriacus]|uniref:RING-type E3 ubiquitin transferase n=1 Tax=Hibiscus syriacus TaxID=106335 RepID=A0A6A2WWM4_HIBSY|nr:Transducin/WD40 repeat-like superfamily protein, putative isoform 2 [Hibiscus syriacus]